MTKQRIGIYLHPDQILRNPTYLPILRDQLGLNLLVLIYNGTLPPAVLAHSPFDGAPPSQERVRSLLCRDLTGRPCTDVFDDAFQSVGPHVATNGDDQAVRAAIQSAKAAGIEVWLMGGAWTSSDKDALIYCPSKEQNNRWYEAVYTYLATGYDVAGVDITHARFLMRSYPRGLFLCTCTDCAHSASELGYDMEAMKAAIHGAAARIQEIDLRLLRQAARFDMGLFDYLQLLGMDPGLVQWFRFRADLLGRNLKRFRDAVHAAAGHDFIFGADTYPASHSLLAGHNHARWGEFSDFASPLLSHVDIFPMRTLVETTRWLCTLHPDLPEREALQLVYRFSGYDHLAMPESLADFALGEPDCEFRHIPLVEMLRLDMAKARLYLPPGIPSYPIIQGGGAPHPWPRVMIQAIMADALATGHDGYIFQGTQSLIDFDLKG